MSDVNEQIAKIAGWTNVAEHEYEHGTTYLLGQRPDGFTDVIPDYRAPENLHELVQVAVQVCKENDWDISSNWRLEWTVNLHNFDGELVGPGRDKSLSDALIAAIIEAKG